MSVQKTQAAKDLHESQDVSPHKLISLLMDGAIERIEQAKDSIASDNEADRLVLFGKITAIVNGLKGSLDFTTGGEIAKNLDTLYGYILLLLKNADNNVKRLNALDEAALLIKEVKGGWDGIEENVAA